MSSGSGVIAGPEVDMAELDVVSSAPLAVDLNLNLGPSFALELALGGQDFEESVPVSRPNWPRFEPSILAGGQEDDTPPMADEPNANLATSEDHQDSVSVNIRARDLTGFDAGSRRGVPHGALGRGGRDNQDDAEGPLRGLLQAFRNGRHFRHPRRPRQVSFAAIQEIVQTQDSSEHGSTTEGRAIGAGDSALSVILPRGTRDELTPNTNLEIAPIHESTQESDKKAEAPPVGAHFECNICLEMATEPVVTCCGHLFCWPCLHRWLHVHSTEKECPVCKGILSDDVITPIYGRGTAHGTDKASGSIPPRPHAHRINGKRQWQDRFVRDGSNRIAATVDADSHADRSEPEASNAAELVLNRLRVAQRLQREYIDERMRLRIHQRLMGRRGGGAFRSPATIGAAASQASASPIRSAHQHRSEPVLTRMAINRLETADSLAAIGASMDGLRENLEHMQRTLESVSTLPVQAGIFSSGEAANTGSSAVAEALLNEERGPPPSEIESPSLGHSTNAELQVETPELPQTSRRGWQRAANSSSGSFDAEPDSLHVRKRRRLN